MSKKKFNPIDFAQFTQNKLAQNGHGDFTVRVEEIDHKHYHFTVSKFGFDFVTICNDYAKFDLGINMTGDNWFSDNLMFAVEIADLIKVAVNIINSYSANE